MTSRLVAAFSHFLSDDGGTTAIEYALIASILSVSIIGGATAIGGNLDGIFSNVKSFFP
jgi:pilus assembly protein Flp/PilA